MFWRDSTFTEWAVSLWEKAREQQWVKVMIAGNMSVFTPASGGNSWNMFTSVSSFKRYLRAASAACFIINRTLGWDLTLFHSNLLICYTIWTFCWIFKIQHLYCHVHNNYLEAVVGNEILKCQDPSDNAQKICMKKITQVKGELKT